MLLDISMNQAEYEHAAVQIICTCIIFFPLDLYWYTIQPLSCKYNCIVGKILQEDFFDNYYYKYEGTEVRMAARILDFCTNKSTRKAQVVWYVLHMQMYTIDDG